MRVDRHERHDQRHRKSGRGAQAAASCEALGSGGSPIQHPENENGRNGVVTMGPRRLESSEDTGQVALTGQTSLVCASSQRGFRVRREQRSGKFGRVDVDHLA